MSNEKLSENGVIAERTMNTLLHIMEAYTELYKADGFYAVGDSIREILRIFKFKVYNSDKKICDVFFDKYYHSLIELESYGHDIEASWLIDRACQVLGDKAYYTEMLPVINQLAERAYENGIDMQNKAMNNECENGKVSAKKVWWVQAEGVVGFLNAFQRYNNPSYLEIAKSLWEYIKDSIIDKREGGEWYSQVFENGAPDMKKPTVDPWKCPYHNGRMCLEVIKRGLNETF